MTKPYGRFLNAVCIAGFITMAYFASQSTAQTLQPQPDSVAQWYRDAKYGMFIHWGLYSGPAQGEWYMNDAAIPIDTYRKYAYPASHNPGDTAYFQADAFLAGTTMRSNWAQFANAAGMKYMVVTSRHHDGYSLTDSCHPNGFYAGQTLGKDLIALCQQRCRDAGLRFGAYISVLDWRFPGYFDVSGTNCLPNKWGYTTSAAHKENARLMKEVFYAHVTHVMKKYAPLDYVFWDGGYLGLQGSDADAAYFWEPDKYRSLTNQWLIDDKYAEYDSSVTPPRPLGVMGICRKYSPNIIANPRLGWVGDVDSREGNFADNGAISSTQRWERACNYNVQGGGYSAKWGYVLDWRPMGYNGLVTALTNALVRDGNLLLNFGPDRHGNIPQAAVDTVLRMGTWLAKVGDAVYGTRGGPWQPVDNQYGFTYKTGKIFIHILPGYSGTTFTTSSIPGGNAQVTLCYDLNTQSNLSFTKNGNGTITINGINRTIHPPNSLVGIYMGTTPTATRPPAAATGHADGNKPLIIRKQGEVAARFPSIDAARRSTLTLFSFDGRCMRCPIRRAAMDVTINTSRLNDGVYCLKVLCGGSNSVVYKISIQKKRVY
jgi:alpha-L-fucosidase